MHYTTLTESIPINQKKEHQGKYLYCTFQSDCVKCKRLKAEDSEMNVRKNSGLDTIYRVDYKEKNVDYQHVQFVIIRNSRTLMTSLQT